MKMEYIKPTVELERVLNIVPLCASPNVTAGGIDGIDVGGEDDGTKDINPDVKGDNTWGDMW